MIKRNLFLPLLFAATLNADASWRWDDPQPQGNALFSSAVSAGSNPAVVAVGEFGSALRSVSSGPWTSQSVETGGRSLQSVVWTGARFLAAGSSAGLWQSTEGAVWTLLDDSVRSPLLLHAAGKTVAMAASKVWVSGGGTFAEHPLESSGISSFRGAVSDGTRFLLYGDEGLVATSLDGISWAKSPLDAKISFYTAGGGSSGFLVGGVNDEGLGIILRSGDGVVWESLALPSPQFLPVRIFRLVDGWLVQDYLSGLFYRRADTASAWEQVSSDLPGFYPNSSVVSPSGRVLFFGDRGIVAALDGGKIVADISGALDSVFLYSPRFSSAASGNIFAAIDANVPNSRLVRYCLGIASPEGIAWQSPDPAPVRGLVALAPVGTGIVGYSTGASDPAGSGIPPTFAGFYRTSDGLSWQGFGAVEDEDGLPLLQGDVVSIASRPDESAIVVVTRSDTSTPLGYSAVRGIYCSTDWKEWRQIALPEFRAVQPLSEESPESVTWDGSQFVLLLYPGRVFTSADGLVWKSLPALPAGLAAVSVASGAGVVVARTAILNKDGSLGGESSGGEKIMVFDGGRWWSRDTSRRSPVLQRRVMRAGNMFVATGAGAEILTSSDGFSWQSHPTPGAPYDLLWNGERLSAFNDSFAAFSRAGLPQDGTPLGIPLLSSRARSVGAVGETYTMSLDIAAGTAWTVGALPSWVAVSPVSGNGPSSVTITVAANSASFPRGARLQIAGQPHFILQQGTEPFNPGAVSNAGSSLKFPFSGDWDMVVAPPGLVTATKGATSGAGSFVLTFPRNDSASPRTITVDINGTEFVFNQQATPLAELLAGTYTGLVGYLPQDVSPSDLDSYQSAFEGYLRVVVAPPAKGSSQGSYSAQLTFHNGAKVSVYRASGPLSPDGTVTGALWSADKGGPQLEIDNMSVVRDATGRQYLTGEFRNDGFRFGIIASRNIYSAKSAPLSAEFARVSTFLLTTYGESGVSADSGVGSVQIGVGGVATIRGILAGGAKFTASSALWGAIEPQLVLPFAFPAGPSQLVCGFSRYDASSYFTDWDGLCALVAPGQNEAGQPETALRFLSSSLCTFTPAPKGGSPLRWSAPASVRLSAPAIGSGTFDGEVTSPSPGKLAVTFSGGAQMKLALDARSGLLRGTFAAGPDAKSVSVLGALTQKQYNAVGDVGGFLGMLPSVPGGRFEILPP